MRKVRVPSFFAPYFLHDCDFTLPSCSACISGWCAPKEAPPASCNVSCPVSLYIGRIVSISRSFQTNLAGPIFFAGFPLHPFASLNPILYLGFTSALGQWLVGMVPVILVWSLPLFGQPVLPLPYQLELNYVRPLPYPCRLHDQILFVTYEYSPVQIENLKKQEKSEQYS